jgi:hypothetical protein
VRWPVIFRVAFAASNFKFDSQVKLFASPPTFVMIELLVALDTRGTFITSAASDVLKLPERMFTPSDMPGPKYLGAITVPVSLL